MTQIEGVFGLPPRELAEVSAKAVQFSPLVLASQDIETFPAGGLSRLTMLAPPGTLERRYALACGLRALAPGAEFCILGLKKKGGNRLMDELISFGCDPVDNGRQHYRICDGERPDTLHYIDEAIEAGKLQRVEETGLWSQPGVFSWNHVDDGSALLAEHLPKLSGHGADLGSGIGTLALVALGSPDVASITLVDTDRRAIEAAKRNISDKRAQFVWQDVRRLGLQGLDFMIMNPPFHEAGLEDQPLGQEFVLAAAKGLRTGGRCWLVANRHLPYEAALRQCFSVVKLLVETGSYKVYEARR